MDSNDRNYDISCLIYGFMLQLNKGGEIMKNLIFSKDNSIEPNGAIGIQKCGIM